MGTKGGLDTMGAAFLAQPGGGRPEGACLLD